MQARWLLSILAVLFLSAPAWAQQELRSGTKGSSAAAPVTSTSIDANHQALDVNIAAGGGTGGGPADTAPNAAASESDTARQKVSGTLRLYDTGQAAGSQLVTAKGDQTSGLWVNCKSGCAGASGDGTGSGTITAGGQRVSLALSTYAGAGVTITGTWTATLKPQVSYDGGTTWVDTVLLNDATRVVSSTTTSNNSFSIPAVGGASHVAITTSAFTSGTVNIALRTTAAATQMTLVGTSDGNLLSTANTGRLQVDVVTGGGSNASVGTAGAAIPSSATFIGGTDGINLQGARVVTSSPGNSDAGLVTRNINPNLTTDNATASSSANKVPSLVGRANAAAPNWTEGFNVPLSVDLLGNLRVNSTGGGLTDQSTFTAGSTTESPTGGVYNDSLSALTSGVTGAVRETAFRAMHHNLRDSFGNELGLPSNPLTVRFNLNSMGLLTQASGLSLPQGLSLNNNQPAFAFLANQGAFRGYTGAVQGDYGLVVHPSVAPAKQCPLSKPISTTANMVLVAGQAGKIINYCFVKIVSTAAESYSLVEGTGTTCGTNTVAVDGGTSASIALSATGGFVEGGDRIVGFTTVLGNDLCLLKSGAGNVSGRMTYNFQ